MAMKRVFKSTINSCRFIFEDGTVAHFNSYKYFTDKEGEIAELEAEVSKGHPHIYIDAKEREVEVDADPLDTIRKKAIEDFIKANNLAIDPSRIMGSTEQEKLRPVTSQDVHSGAEGSASGDVALTAKVAALSGEK